MTVQSNDTAGVVRDLITASVPEPHRRHMYDEKRKRLAAPPYHYATIEDVAEVLGCSGCRASQRNGVRVVDVKRGCPVHSGGAR